MVFQLQFSVAHRVVYDMHVLCCNALLAQSIFPPWVPLLWMKSLWVQSVDRLWLSSRSLWMNPPFSNVKYICLSRFIIHPGTHPEFPKKSKGNSSHGRLSRQWTRVAYQMSGRIPDSIGYVYMPRHRGYMTVSDSDSTKPRDWAS